MKPQSMAPPNPGAMGVVMGSIRYWIITGVAGLSLLLCFAVAVIWASSYRRDVLVKDIYAFSDTGDRVPIEFQTRIHYAKFVDWDLETIPGAITWRLDVYRICSPRWMGPTYLEEAVGFQFNSNLRSTYEREHAAEECLNEEEKIKVAGGWVHRGFGYSLVRNREIKPPIGSDFRQQLMIPDWALLTLFAVFPFLRFLIFLTKRRGRTENLCAWCGYDLRATPERCPECGLATDFDDEKIRRRATFPQLASMLLVKRNAKPE